MEPPPDFSLKEEIEQMREVFGPQQPQPETDFGRGVSRHPWVLISVAGLALTLSGALFGRVVDSNAREHELFRKAIEDQARWIAAIDRKVDSQETRLANYGDDSRRALRMMEEMREESLRFWRVAARERGDEDTVRRIDNKLKRMPPIVGTTGGQ